MVEHKLISTPLRHKARNKAEGKCEECGKRLFQRRKDALIQQYCDKVTREIAHIWRRDGALHNIGLDNLELVCDTCYNELKTTRGGDEIEKETLEVWVNPATKVEVEVPLGTHKLLGDLIKTANACAEAAKVKSG